MEELEALEKVVEEETPKNVRVRQYFRTVAAEKPAGDNGGKPPTNGSRNPGDDLSNIVSTYITVSLSVDVKYVYSHSYIR